jgi:hypothetical protein
MNPIVELSNLIDHRIQDVDCAIQEIRDSEIGIEYVNGLTLIKNEYENRKKLITSTIGWLSLSYIVGTIIE